jgi:tRNA (mo5U34)-methyltransferase
MSLVHRLRDLLPQSKSQPTSSWTALRQAARLFAQKATATKKAIPNIEWYPYSTYGMFEAFAESARPDLVAWFDPQTLRSAADFGAGDGDLSLFLNDLGVEHVDAFDQSRTNFNGMKAVTALQQSLGAAMDVWSTDFDFDPLPGTRQYDVAFAFGLIYHLKNPIGFLEKLSRRSARIVLSTRVARSSPMGFDMSDHLAYLLAPGQANNDETNYWIFSPAAMLRCIEVAGFQVEHSFSTNGSATSNPVAKDKDERLFVFATSRNIARVIAAALQNGHQPELTHCWTKPQFTLQIGYIGRASHASVAIFVGQEEFAIRQTIRVEMKIGEQQTMQEIHSPGYHRLRCAVPASAAEVLDWHMKVDRFAAPTDERELGLVLVGETVDSKFQPDVQLESLP